MRERLLRRYVRQIVSVSSAERASGRGENERVDGLERPALQALEGRTVLAVHRQEQAPSPLPCRESELAGGDKAFLVRERERRAALERPERRPEAGEADDGVEDDVRLGALEELGRVAAHLCERSETVDRL